MLSNRWIITCAAVLLASTAWPADRVTPDYLAGTWSLEGEPACGGSDLEHIVLDRDGAFRSYRRGRLEAAGFWYIGNDYIEFHVISSVGILNPKLKEYIGHFSSARIDALETKVERNRLELAVKVGDKMDHWRMDRCAR